LHVKLDGVTTKSDVVRWIGFVPKGQLGSKLLGVERNRPLDIPRADNRVRFEHCRLRHYLTRDQDAVTSWFVLFVALLLDPLAIVLLLAATAQPNMETTIAGVV